MHPITHSHARSYTFSYTLSHLLIYSPPSHILPPSDILPIICTKTPVHVHMSSPNKFDTNLPLSRAYIQEPSSYLEQPTAESATSGTFPPTPPPIPFPARNESFSQSPLKLGIMKSLLDFDLRHKPMNATSRERRRTTLLPSFLQSTIHGSPPGSPIHDNTHNRYYFK